MIPARVTRVLLVVVLVGAFIGVLIDDLRGAGWLVAGILVPLLVWLDADVRRWKRVAGERATCWTLANKRAEWLDRELKRCNAERAARLIATAGAPFAVETERLGAMPEATGCGRAATRTEGEASGLGPDARAVGWWSGPTCACGAPLLYHQREKGSELCGPCERRRDGTETPADLANPLRVP